MKSLQERMKEVWLQARMVQDASVAYDAKQSEADTCKQHLQNAQTRLQGLQDDLLGDLLNGCFPEAPLEGELGKIAEGVYRGTQTAE